MSSCSRSTGACVASGRAPRASCMRSRRSSWRTASREPPTTSVGRRRRTRYTITAKGRRALAAWLQQPGEGPVLEFEQLLKISFSDSGTKADILANLDATRMWVLEQNEENLATGHAYLEGRGSVPATRGAEPTRWTLPHRVLRHGRPVGGVDVGHREGLARRRARGTLQHSRRRGKRPAGGEHHRHPRGGRGISLERVTTLSSQGLFSEMATTSGRGHHWPRMGG